MRETDFSHRRFGPNRFYRGLAPEKGFFLPRKKKRAGPPDGPSWCLRPAAHRRGGLDGRCRPAAGRAGGLDEQSRFAGGRRGGVSEWLRQE